MFLKLVKKVITNLDLSNTSDPDCILLVILNNREPEIWYILAEFLNFVWKNIFFQIVGSSHFWFLYWKMLGRGILQKTNALLVFFLQLAKSFKYQ